MRAIDAFFERLARLQIGRPAIPIACVLTFAVLGGWLALHLSLRTRFDQLLPDDQPSVVALRRVEARTSSAQTALILLEGDDEQALRRFGDAIVEHVKTLAPDDVTTVEDGVQPARDFLRARAGLFLDRAALDKLSLDAQARWDWEIARATDTALDESSEPPPIDHARLEKIFAGHASAQRIDRYPAGYYEREDGKALVVVVRSPAPLGDLHRVQHAIDEIRGATAAARASDKAFAPVRASFTGDMVAGLEEYGAVRNDLLHVGAMGLALVLGVVVLYFMRFRALVVMTATIACGLAVTFGVTELAIGHLNVATGFLFSIIAGNGINVGILYLSRYYEEKRGGATTADAIRTAHRTTWPSTSVAALASAAAYSSLAITSFRTFEQFAFIGASGMIACWLVTVTLLPALLVVIDSRPMPAPSATDSLFARVRRGVPYGNVFAWLVPKAPLLILGASVVVTIVGVVGATRWVVRDPMEYDLTRLQDDQTRGGELRRAWGVSTGILGKFDDAMVVLADTPAHAAEAQRVLRARWERAPTAEKPFEAAHAIFDFVPPGQEEKLPILLALSERVRDARARNLIHDDDWANLAPFLPAPDAKPFGVDDLPDALARPFSTTMGPRGTLVLIEPTTRGDTNDLHYLLRYAESFRELRLADGTVLHGAGRALVFADILDAVITQTPRALALSLVLTIAAVLVAFQHGKSSFAVMATLLVGFAGVGAFLYFTNVKLNFLNFVALPITFGIGVDYAVNVMQRHRADGERDILGVLRTTGGAIVLCSLTTTLGYLALIGSHNQAIRSLGIVAVVGEVCCLLSAVLVLPAGLQARNVSRR